MILPAYNEEAGIASTVAKVLEMLATWTSDFEVIMVNDGSPIISKKPSVTSRGKEPIRLEHVELFSCPVSLFKYWLSK